MRPTAGTLYPATHSVTLHINVGSAAAKQRAYESKTLVHTARQRTVMLFQTLPPIPKFQLCREASLKLRLAIRKFETSTSVRCVAALVVLYLRDRLAK